MKDKMSKKDQIQAHIDTFVQEYDFVDCSIRNETKEIECHLDVDLILSNSTSVFPKHTKSKITSNHVRHVQNHSINTNRPISLYHTSHTTLGLPKREKLIVNLHDSNKKENTIGNMLYSMFL